jgi:hypothetical protein
MLGHGISSEKFYRLHVSSGAHVNMATTSPAMAMTGVNQRHLLLRATDRPPPRAKCDRTRTFPGGLPHLDYYWYVRPGDHGHLSILQQPDK